MTEKKRMVYEDDAATGFEGKDAYYWAKALIQEKLETLSPQERSEVSGVVSLAGSLLGRHTSGKQIDPDIVNAFIIEEQLVPRDIVTKSELPDGTFKFDTDRDLQRLAIIAGRASATNISVRY